MSLKRNLLFRWSFCVHTLTYIFSFQWVCTLFLLSYFVLIIEHLLRLFGNFFQVEPITHPKKKNTFKNGSIQHDTWCSQSVKSSTPRFTIGEILEKNTTQLIDYYGIYLNKSMYIYIYVYHIFVYSYLLIYSLFYMNPHMIRVYIYI